MRVIKPILLLTAFNCISAFLFSQNNSTLLKRCPVKTINFELGLSNNTSTDVITDALGFTWISTETGMQRYNGYILETINPVINRQVININGPVSFFALQNGLIWISYKQGILAYEPQTNSFKKIITIHDSYNLNFSIIPVKQTSEGIWCLQNGKGLVIYSPENGKLTKTVAGNTAFVQNVFNQPEVVNNATFTANQDAIFICNGKDEVQEINVQTEKISYIRALNILKFVCSNTTLYAISNNGITSININGNTSQRTIPLKKIINEDFVDGSCFLNGNDQLLISLNSHLFEFDTKLNYKYEFANLNRNAVVTVGFIRTIYADKFKRIWLLTNDDIKRVQNFDIPFEHLIYAADKNNFVRSIYYDETKHIILAGCYNGGIQLYDTAGNALWATAVSTINVKDINAIGKLTDADYLVVTIGRGIYVLNLPSKKIKPLLYTNLSKNKIDANNINFTNNIQRVNDSTILVATSTNVYKCYFNKDYCVAVKPMLAAENISLDRINCFLYAKNKVLWVGTTTGKIYTIDSMGKFLAFRIPENYSFRSITEDAQKNIWIGSDKGLYVYNTSKKLIKVFTTQSGLLNDCIYALLPIQNTTAVFASSNLGLSFISLNGSIINYTRESGLQENEFNTQSSVKTKEGKYYFGGVNGITSFYPSSLLNIKDTPVLNIIKLVINDSTYNSSPGFWKGDTIKLKFTQNHIQLSFAALGLLNTNEYVYKYRLQNFEKNWQTTHEPTGIKYVLEPGNYLFEIKCSPVFSSKNVFKKSILIIVSPPVWQTWWFKLLMLCIGIAIVALAIRQYLNRRYQKKLNALKLTHEIQHERERISHDLHDNLGAYAAAIASNISLIRNTNYNTSEEVFNQLKNNSQSIINQLNDTIWALNKEAIFLTAVSDRFKVFLQKIRPSFPHINIEIKESIIHDELLSPANALHLFRIMQEAVNNALKHSGGNDVFIELMSEKKWIVIIKDNGKGMPDNEKIIYGNGLNNIKTRSTAAGWNVQWISETGNGTEVIISATTN